MRKMALLLLFADLQVPKHTVTGMVVNAMTGEPIRRALVQMNGPTQASMLTGPDGRFQFENVPEGTIFLSPQRPGFFNDNSTPQFKVTSDKNDFQLKLNPSAHITGHVIDGDGQPVETTTIHLMAAEIVNGRKEWQNRQVASTDEDGEFRIDELMPGRYVLYCRGEALPAMSFNAPRQVIAPAYYPDAVDRSAAQPVDLQAGQEFVADFHLKKVRGYQVTAQLSGVSANLLPMAYLQIENSDKAHVSGARFDRKRGQFVFDAVPSGTWQLVYRGNDSQGRFLESRRELTVDHADVQGLVLEAQASQSIPVTVIRDDGEAQNPNVFAQLTAVDGGNQYQAQMQGNPPTPAFPNVPPGKYRLRAQMFGNECMQSAQYGGTDLLRDYLTIGPGETPQPIVIHMAKACGQLEVEVKAGDNSQVSVVVVSGSPMVDPVNWTTSGNSVLMGNGLAPGIYQAYAFSTLDGLEYANPEVMRNYKSESVTLEAGQTKRITLDVNERKKD